MDRKVIGIDIGATKISGIVFDGRKILDGLNIVTPKDLVSFQRSILKLVDFLSAERKISGIGAGMAGLVDSQKGVVSHSPNIRFVKNLNLAETLRYSGIKNVKVANDAKCFVFAEALTGQGKGKHAVAGVTLGTGIGGGLCIDRKIYRGANFGAMEVGHMLYDGKKTYEQVFQAARDGHNNKNLAKIVGSLLANIYRAVDPELLVIGGGVALDKKRNFFGQAKATCAATLSSYRIKPKIKVSKLKNAGAIGAALLVLN